VQLIVAGEPDLGTVVKSDGAYVAEACWIQQASIVPKARCNHPFRMVGQQHPHSDRKSFQSTEVAFLTINSLEEILE